MSDQVFVTLIWVALALFLGLLFPPTRAVISVVAGQLWKLLEWLLKVAWNGLQAGAVRVWRAHLIVAVNLMPRRAALPSVGEKGTRRD